MGQRLPKADTNFNGYTDTQLISVCQKIHDDMSGSGNFPTPPIVYADYQLYIDDYQSAVSAAIKGSKSQTATKNNAKQLLINVTRAYADYVNQTVYNGYYNGTSSIAVMENLKVQVLSSGFKLQKDPNPVGQIPVPIIQEASSLNIGELYIRVKNYTAYKKGVKVYQVNYRPKLTVPADWKTDTFTDSRMTLSGLTSGEIYQVQIAAIGGNQNDRAKLTNFSQIIEKVII